MKTLKLFNAVVAKKSYQSPVVTKKGIIIESDALWAQKRIIKYYDASKLDALGLNQTFYKSWKVIRTSSRVKLLTEQIKHYVSTYGSNFQERVYIPNEILDVPEAKLSYFVVKAYSKEEMTSKCLDVLQSGLALKDETINDVLSILVDELAYQFTGEENLKNKEAIVKIAEFYGITPKNTVEFFRYIIYRSTGDTLLIKNAEIIEKIKASAYNPAVQFERFGLEKLAEIFNRFKPLFLAYKVVCPRVINKLSKLSKKHHKPLIANPLSLVTTVEFPVNQEHWLDQATPYALFKALSACYTRINGQYAFAYRIRNGKSFVKSKSSSDVVWNNYYFLLEYLKKRFNFSGKKFYLPEDIEYALPTSEKMFVGSIPTGTKFFGESLAVGIYWENQWGANDLDLSGLNIGGKVGWNASFNQGGGDLMYSGDMTNARNGAAEYLHARFGLGDPTLIQNNVYSGAANCKYKIILGHGDDIDMNYMMNPNNLLMEAECQSVQRQTVLGLLLPENERQCFVLLNFGAGECRVSGDSVISSLATKALYQQWSNALTFRDLVTDLGGEVVSKKELADFDLSLENLQKDSFIKVFS